MKDSIINHLVVLIFTTILIIISINIHMLSVIAFSIIVIYLWYADDYRTVEVLLYLLPLAMIFKYNPRGTSFFTYVEIIVVAFYFIKQKQIVNNTILAYVLVLGLYIIAMQLVNFGINGTLTIKLLSGFFVLIVVTNLDADKDYAGVFLHYIAGLLISSIIAYFLDGPFNVKAFFENQEIVIINGEIFNRFSGLYSDPNYYSINLLIAFCLIISMIYKNKIHVGVALLLVGMFLFFASQTQSKSALLSLAIPGLFMIYSLYKAQKQKLLVLICCIIFIFVYLLLNDKIPMFSNIIYRLKNASGADSLTTGRSTLWLDYVEYIIRNPKTFIFGESVLTYSMDGRLAPHNTYIDLFFQLGLVGTIILMGLLSCISQTIDLFIDKNLMNYSVFVCIAVMYFCISELQSYEAPFHLIIGIIIYHIDFSRKIEESEG